MGATDVAERDILANALANMSLSDLKSAYGVKRGGSFINEYPRLDKDGQRTDGGPHDPNHLMGSFPTLLPYAQGGIETNRPIPVSYADHVRRDLQYWDKRFRKDLHYVFQTFGVLQKRQVFSHACLQIKKKDFLRNEEAIGLLKPSDLLKAAGEESRRVPFSNPSVRSLRRHITSVRSEVMGTDESRVGIRSKVWSLTAAIGPPSLWITINPSDTGDPIAQVLAGVDIDLDRFSASLGPDASTRSNTIAADPYAASKYFHFIIDTVLTILFGVKADRNRSHVKCKPGIFGEMAAYIGTVEAQGRGTLHFHVICWMKGAPSADRIRELLTVDDFRGKIVKFIGSCIRSDIKGADGSEIRAMKREDSVSFSRPVNPQENEYSVRCQKAEEKLARAVQIHSCTREACLDVVKGRLVCKRNAPFPLSKTNWISEDGSWGSKIIYGYVNAWSPAILQTVRANQDIKLITNGAETKDLAWYITNYVAKKQRESSNLSILLAKRIAFHNKQERYTADITKRNRRLLQRCTNTLSREQVFSAPEVMSYLMGFGDRKISHHFESLYTGELFSALREAYPCLRHKK